MASFFALFFGNPALGKEQDMKKDELKEYLSHNCRGRKRAVSGKRLRILLHTSENEIRKSVNRLRRDGVPIASNQTGYYFAQTAGEIYATIQNLQKMKMGLAAAITGLEGALEKFEGETDP